MTEGMICNQRQIPPDQWRYGFRKSAATGCGWIATYNALRLLGHTTDIEELIRWFQWQLPLINGNAGTALWGPAQRFYQWGFPVETILRRKDFDAAAREADACILFFRWREGLKLGAHFVALHHTPAGFVGYNTFPTSQGEDRYGESLDRFLEKRGYFGCVLFCIQQK